MPLINIPVVSFALELAQVILVGMVMLLSTYVTVFGTESSPPILNVLYILLGVSSFAVLTWTYIKFGPRYFRITVFALYVQVYLTGLISLLFMALAIALAAVVAETPGFRRTSRSWVWIDMVFTALTHITWTIRTLLLRSYLSKIKDDSTIFHDIEKSNAVEI